MAYIFLMFLMFVSLWAQEAPIGEAVLPSAAEQKLLDQMQGRLDGQIVWSTSRSNSRHDIWIMKADGSESRQLTKSDFVDWFPRISPDGKTVLFNRSKIGWIPETDADFPEKWDLWSIEIETAEEKKLVDRATWGTWRPDGESIVFSRGANVFTKNLATGDEILILEGEKHFGRGIIVQEPNMSPNGKYIAATLRGSKRETGIWDLEKNTWSNSGDGCQIDWFPSGDKVYRVNPTGNGGTAAPSEILWFNVKEGKQVEKVGFFGVPAQVKLMDLPGRRSHEYFPKVDQIKGEWLVWGATDRGHDHDIYDYELYIWKIGTPFSEAVRITFHTGNDRWPDLWLRQ
jgi:Tol biopolymer transport system component